MSMAKQTPQFLMGADGSLGYESSGKQVSLVYSSVDPVSGAVDLRQNGRSIGAKIGATSVTYDSQNRVSTYDSWTISYDASGRASSQTNGTLTQTFNYDSAGRYTGITEA